MYTNNNNNNLIDINFFNKKTCLMCDGTGYVFQNIKCNICNGNGYIISDLNQNQKNNFYQRNEYTNGD